MDSQVHKVSRVEVNGSPNGNGARFLVKFDDVDVFLTKEMFALFSMYANARQAGMDDGWHTEKHGLRMYTFRLRRCLWDVCDPNKLITTNRRGGYRLNIEPGDIRIKWRNLLRVDHVDVRRVAEDVRARERQRELL